MYILYFYNLILVNGKCNNFFIQMITGYPYKYLTQIMQYDKDIICIHVLIIYCADKTFQQKKKKYFFMILLK